MEKMFENPLDSRQKGKIAEFYVISKLIAKGIDVYVPVLDIGVDCIARVQKKGRPNEYYDFQIKGARLDSNISIRNARKIIEHVKATRGEYEKNLERFFLIVPLRKNGDYEEIIYLNAQEIEKKATKQWGKEQDINISTKDKEWFLNNRSWKKLLEMMQ